MDGREIHAMNIWPVPTGHGYVAARSNDGLGHLAIPKGDPDPYERDRTVLVMPIPGRVLVPARRDPHREVMPEDIGLPVGRVTSGPLRGRLVYCDPGPAGAGQKEERMENRVRALATPKTAEEKAAVAEAKAAWDAAVAEAKAAWEAGKYDIPVDAIRAEDIREVCLQAGITHCRRDGENGEIGEGHVMVYALPTGDGCEVRVATSNSYSVWEEQDPEIFAEYLRETGVTEDEDEDEDETA